MITLPVVAAFRPAFTKEEIDEYKRDRIERRGYWNYVGMVNRDWFNNLLWRGKSSHSRSRQTPTRTKRGFYRNKPNK